MRAISKLLIATLAGICATTAAQPQVAAPPAYDIVIRHGKVLDGAGNPWIAADVAISNGRFVKIGKVEGAGRQEIDASGLYVSPGWIDVMDQSADVLLKNGMADNKLREGVTTAIAGEGGTPVDADHIDEYFTKLKQQGISMNFGCYYSEAQARIAVIGQVDRPPTPEELVKMKGLMAMAMQQGAMGMTTALIYPPSSYAKTDELIAMAKVAGAYGGLYASHMRGEGKEGVQAVDELRARRRDCGRPLRVHRRRNRSGGDNSFLGIRWRGCRAEEAPCWPRDSRAFEARSADRLTRMVEHY